MNEILLVVASIFGGILAVETAGYFWHRYAEHNGVLGKLIQSYHIKHHEKDYPIKNLRPKSPKYKKAGSWSWYILTVILVVSTYFLLPRPYNFIMIISGLIYAKLVISYLHSRFHVTDHFLAKLKVFKTIQRLHDIHHWGPYNYGILFFFMDRVFGTYKPSFPSKKQTNFILE